MEDKVVFDVKEANLDVIIPGVAINGLAFEDKREADKFIKKYLSGSKHHVQERVEKPIYSSVEEFEKDLKRKLLSLRKHLKEFDVLKEKYPNEFYDFDKLYIEYSISKIETFFDSAKEDSAEKDTERI